MPNTKQAATGQPRRGRLGQGPPRLRVRHPALLGLRALSGGSFRLLEGFLGALLAGSTVLIGYTVFARYVLRKPPSWTEELALFFMVWLGLLSGAAGVARRAHVSVQFVLGSLPAAVRRVVQSLIDLAVGLFGAFVAIRGVELCRLAWLQQASSVPFRMGQVYIALPLSGVIILVLSLRNAVSVWGGSR